MVEIPFAFEVSPWRMIEWIFHSLKIVLSDGEKFWVVSVQREYEQNHPKECAVCGHKRYNYTIRKVLLPPRFGLLEENVEWLWKDWAHYNTTEESGTLGHFVSQRKCRQGYSYLVEKIKNRPKWNGEKWVYPK